MYTHIHMYMSTYVWTFATGPSYANWKVMEIMSHVESSEVVINITTEVSYTRHAQSSFM